MNENPLAATFNGYQRADGRRGVRNWLVVAYTVYCAEHVARRIVEPFRLKGTRLIGFDQCYPSDYGHGLMEKLLTHPNVGAVLLMSLGCEEFRRADLLAAVKASGREIRSLVIQETGGTEKSIEAGRAIVSETLPRLEMAMRSPMTAADLVIGLECGGSDALSGITANPAVGLFTDRLIDAGGTAILEETNELFGCEAHLASRARTPEIGKATVRIVKKAMEYHRRLGHASFGGGNITGGLSTIEEKSAGAYSKCGTRPLDGILIPGQQPPGTGLYLLDTVYDSDLRHGIPNIHDPHGMTAMAACGCHLIVFTTGRGSVVGQAVSPVIKVASNSEMYRRLAGDMDVNAGIAVQTPDGLQAVAEEIARVVVLTAAGDSTRAEALGHMESYISDGYFRPGPGICRNPGKADETLCCNTGGNMDENTEKYRATDLERLAREILIAAGLEQEKAVVVARGLLEGDLMGASTHGLALLPSYVDELEKGEMTASGKPEVLRDFGATALWDGRYLPGIWLTREAGLEASRRAAKFGVGLVTIRRSHHIACLGHYLLAAVNRGDIMLIYSSDPSDSHVAPYGGVNALMTPNPIAAGIPAEPWPILVDISTSVTTAGLCERSHREGKRLPGKWLLTGAGELSDDPAAFGPPQGGTILPVGGLDHGHKGYGLSLMVEALSQGLSGFGRPEKPTTWGAAVMVQVIRPEAFLPMEEFRAQVDWLVSACLNGEKRPGVAEIVVPGQREMIRRDEALRSGLTLYPGVAESLAGLAARYGLPMPAPIETERKEE